MKINVKTALGNLVRITWIYLFLMVDEILTYSHIKPRVQRFLNEEDSPTDPFRIAQRLGGYTHRARLRAPSDKKIWPSLTRPQLPPRAQRLPRALGSQSTTPPGLALSSCLAIDASQGPGTRRQVLGYRCRGAPWHRSLGMHLLAAPLIGSCPRHDTRRQSFPRPPGARRLSGPHVSP
jgi:hypothetical protein